MSRTRDLDKFEFVKTVYDFVHTRDCEQSPLDKLESQVLYLENQNGSLNLVHHARKIFKRPDDRIFFYYLCNKSLSDCVYLDFALRNIYGWQHLIFQESIRWQNEEHELQIRGLAELGEESFFGSSKVELTEDGLELFLDKDFEKYRKKDKTNDLLRVDKIKEKNLYLNSANFQKILRKSVIS